MILKNRKFIDQAHLKEIKDRINNEFDNNEDLKLLRLAIYVSKVEDRNDFPRLVGRQESHPRLRVVLGALPSPRQDVPQE